MPPSATTERRNVTRRKTFQAGLIHWGAEPEKQMLCFVAEMTDTGARLEIFGTGVLPDCFKLRLSGIEKIYVAWLLWRKDNYVGLSFRPPGEVSTGATITQLDAEAAQRG